MSGSSWRSTRSRRIGIGSRLFTASTRLRHRPGDGAPRTSHPCRTPCVSPIPRRRHAIRRVSGSDRGATVFGRFAIAPMVAGWSAPHAAATGPSGAPLVNSRPSRGRLAGGWRATGGRLGEGRVSGRCCLVPPSFARHLSRAIIRAASFAQQTSRGRLHAADFARQTSRGRQCAPVPDPKTRIEGRRRKTEAETGASPRWDLSTC